MRFGLTALKTIGLSLLLLNAASGQSFSDNFNRADASDLGSNWTNVTGTSTRVISNSAGNVAQSNNLSTLNASNFSDSYVNSVVSIDVFHNGTAATGYVALAFGHNGSSSAFNGLFIKVQDNGSGNFDRIGFYTGINVSSNPFTTANFFNPTSNFTQARMTVWAPDANTISLGLDTDFNSVFDQTYSLTFTNVGTMTFGSQVGIGIFGTNVTGDNFLATTAAVPEPMTISLIGTVVAVGGVLYLRKRRKLNSR